MSKRKGLVILVLVLFLTYSPNSLSAQSDLEGMVKISGTSTIRNWTCEGEASVEAVASQTAPNIPSFSIGVKTVKVNVQVSALDCDNKKMNEHMWKALKLKDHPNINYEMEMYSINSDLTSAQVSGKITIGGVTKPNNITVSLKPLDSNKFMVTGEMDIDMINFNVEPPKLMFGTLKVGKDVKISFTAVVNPSR